MTSPTLALLRLSAAEWDVVQANKKLSRAEARVAELRAVYAAARPLTEAERETLAKHVEEGGALCCHGGLKWLLERVPEPWAHALNGWAYERLSCERYEKSRYDGFAAKVRALKLGEFPCP